MRYVLSWLMSFMKEIQRIEEGVRKIEFEANLVLCKTPLDDPDGGVLQKN